MAVMCTAPSERRLISVICGKQIWQTDGRTHTVTIVHDWDSANFGHQLFKVLLLLINLTAYFSIWNMFTFLIIQTASSPF